MAILQDNTTSIGAVDPRGNAILRCPACGCSNIVKNGLRVLGKGGETQLWLCSECGRRFSQKYIRCLGQRSKCQLGACTNRNAKKLDSVTEIKTVTGENEKSAKDLIEEYRMAMLLDGYKETTITLNRTLLGVLAKKGANLLEPDSVKGVIASQKWGGNYVRNVCNAYTLFLQYLGRHWNQPRYNIVRQLPFIPTEQEIDDLVAGSPHLLAVFLQLIKETAMRRGEAIVLPWRDVDFERRIIYCNYPEKGSNTRIFNNISGRLFSMLRSLPTDRDLVFGDSTINSMKNYLERTRNRLAFKLGNPRLKEIHFHTLRYWKGTMLYHSKPDILVVAEYLGHRNIENTRLYIQLEKSLFENIRVDEYITRIANNTADACKLVEVGFEYVTGEFSDGGKIFRKRK